MVRRPDFPPSPTPPTAAEIAQSQADRAAELQLATARFVRQRWRESVRDARPYMAWNGGASTVYEPRLVYVDDSTPATLAPGQVEPRRDNSWAGWYSPDDSTRDCPPGLDPPRPVRWENESEVRARAMADYEDMQAMCPRNGVRFVPAQPPPPNTYHQRWECARSEPCATCMAHPGASWHLTGETWVNVCVSDPPSPTENAGASSSSGSGRPQASTSEGSGWAQEGSGWPPEASTWPPVAPGWPTTP